MSFRQRNCHFQSTLPFAAVNGKDPVPHNAFHRLCIVVVVLVRRIRIFLCGTGLYRSGRHHQPTHLLSQVGIICHFLRQNVHCPLQCRFSVRHFLLQKSFCLLSRIRPGILCHEDSCQRFQSAGNRHRCPCFPLGTIGQVQVLGFHQCFCTADLFFQFRCQLALCFNRRADFFFPLFQLPQVLQPVVNGTKHLIVQRAGTLFPVPCNKRDRLAVVQQGNGIVDLFLPQLKFGSQFLWNIQIEFLRFCDFNRTVIIV